MRLFFLIILFLTNCSDKETNKISVILTPEKLQLEQTVIDKKEFEKELKIIVDRKIKSGLKKDELIIDLRVDKNTRRGDVADVEVSLRRLNIRQVTYSTY
jgi:biopolymer transport protein ExbD